MNASKDAVSNLRLEAPNTGITGALAAPRGSCAGELPFVVSQPQTHRGQPLKTPCDRGRPRQERWPPERVTTATRRCNQGP